MLKGHFGICPALFLKHHVKIKICIQTYCNNFNALLFGLPKKTYNYYKTLRRTRGWEHITPILIVLHWPPVHFRMDFSWFVMFNSLSKYELLRTWGPLAMAFELSLRFWRYILLNFILCIYFTLYLNTSYVSNFNLYLITILVPVFPLWGSFMPGLGRLVCGRCHGSCPRIEGWGPASQPHDYRTDPFAVPDWVDTVAMFLWLSWFLIWMDSQFKLPSQQSQACVGVTRYMVRLDLILISCFF